MPYGIERDDVVAGIHTHGRHDTIFSLGDLAAARDTATLLYMVFMDDSHTIAGIRRADPASPDFYIQAPEYFSDPSMNNYHYQGEIIGWIDFGCPLY